MPRIRLLLPLMGALACLISLTALSASAEGPIDLERYDGLLAAHTRSVSDVVGTRVDYRALSKSPDWKALSKQVREARPSKLDEKDRLAYWINAYNILTIDLILEHYPVASIRDIGSFLFPVWNQDVATIEGRTVSLGEIEHEILRKMGEPRIHAAIVCASTSCPPLARTAFRASHLDADLDAAMRRWLASPDKGVAIDRAANRVRVSEIFDWFEEDFEAGGGVLATVARYVPEQDAAWLLGPGRRAAIGYLDYDWTLNDLTSAR